MIDAKKKVYCCGCSACAIVCPNKAISMHIDEEGFFYPLIDHEKCVECGLCDAVCPNTNLQHNHYIRKKTPTLYAAKAKDDSIRKNSSSGGVFSVLANDILQNGGTVYGVDMSNSFDRATHIKVEAPAELYRLRGSKYLQSIAGNVFEDIKEHLEIGKKVLFSGTPCQVCGLHNFLNKEYDNLLCVDVVCHGVPSYLVWEKYLLDVKKRLNDEIKRISFRSKRESWKYVCNDNDKSSNNALFYPKEEDVFLRLFQSDCCLRPSCYECFVKRNNDYFSDITLGDFWSINRVDEPFNDGKGISLVITRTEKGDNLLRSVGDKIDIKQEDYITSIQGNSVIEQTPLPENRNTFFTDLNQMRLKLVADKYAPVSNKVKIKSILRTMHLYRPKKRAERKPVAEYGMEFFK